MTIEEGVREEALHQDVRELRAEVERLRLERDAAWAERDRLRSTLTAIAKAADGEVKRLRRQAP